MRIFLITVLFLGFTKSYGAAEDPNKQLQQQQIQELASACLQAKTRDKICEFIVVYKQIGDDALEIVKEYIKLSPTTYALFTIANAAATGRFRIRTRSFINRKANHIYDFKKDETIMWYEMSF